MSLPASNTGKLIVCSLLTALALALSLIDTSISVLFSFLPGFRLGLANAVSLFALYYLGMPWACLVSGARCLLTAVFSGQITAFLFSVLGAFGSLAVMWILRGRISLIKVSTAGGVTHNMMQLLAAALVTSTPSLSYYLPLLLLMGTVTGFILGVLCGLVFKRLRLTALPAVSRPPKLQDTLPR